MESTGLTSTSEFFEVEWYLCKMGKTGKMGSSLRQVREEREARNIPALDQKKAADTMKSTGLSSTGECFEVKW